MKFTEDFNNYIRNLSPADRERELERVGYYAAGHGRPRRPGRTSGQGFPAPPRHSDPFSYTESMGSSMVNEAGAGFQNMASGGYARPENYSQPAQMPISEFRNDKKQALKSGMQRFGMSADALRNIAKTVGIRRLDSSNDLKMIQDHFDKNPKSNPGNRGTSTIDVFGPGRDFYSDRGGDTYSPGRNPGNYGGGRYGEFYSDLPDNTGHGGGSYYGGYGRGSSGWQPRGGYKPPKSHYINNRPQNQASQDRINNRDQDRVNNRDQYQRRPVMSPEELGIAPGQRGGRYGGGGMRVQGGGDDYWREQNKRIADNRRRGIAGKDKRYGGRGVSTIDVFSHRGRPGKNKGYGGRGVSTDDVFGGRRRGARDRARSFIK